MSCSSVMNTCTTRLGTYIKQLCSSSFARWILDAHVYNVRHIGVGTGGGAVAPQYSRKGGRAPLCSPAQYCYNTDF